MLHLQLRCMPTMFANLPVTGLKNGTCGIFYLFLSPQHNAVGYLNHADIIGQSGRWLELKLRLVLGAIVLLGR